MENEIPLSEPWLNGREWEAVKACLDSGWVSTAGPAITRFEERLQEFTESPFAVGVASGTAGLHLALLAAGTQPNDAVLVPTLTFIAPVNAIRYVGAHPVFMDADAASWQMDCAKTEDFLRGECVRRDGALVHRKTGRRVRGILAVHLLGAACDIGRLKEIAQAFGLRLIEDAAEGLGVRFNGRHVGTFGDIGVLSFNGNKMVTSGSGGMVLTADAACAARVRHLSTQAKEGSHEFFHSEIGFNYRLSSLHAAFGWAQMEDIRERISRKLKIARFYREAFCGRADVTPMPVLPECEPTYWLCTILLPDKEARDGLLKRLHEKGIMGRPLFHPIHRLPCYRGEEGYRLETAEKIYSRGVCLPSSVGLTGDQLNRISEEVLAYVK